MTVRTDLGPFGIGEPTSFGSGVNHDGRAFRSHQEDHSSVCAQQVHHSVQAPIHKRVRAMGLLEVSDELLERFPEGVVRNFVIGR